MRGMNLQLVCLTLLAFSSWSLCSDSEEDVRALEADLLTNMHTSKISKASPPSWKMTLLNVCSLINNVNSPAEEAGDMHDDDLVGKRKLPLVLDGFSLEAMLTIFQLQKICRSRAFQHWEIIQEDILDNVNDKNEKEEVIKRKIPYILKRQLYENKPRRPYILKRGSYYY
ncbi:neurotensin/neuromedin N precursor [Mus musculus]|uniref:Neurotensin/neuromedin N n=3 Tax=Mus TaxID=862507 RepID=NEUT_MOUSE|nr:neurotensin/neuromedin N precursor [Mus musculus]XP_021030958.1 neurotensin/neuromedin N [Mus caroli]Q9D3P9.1 RecName: Full=Neurotensin/neuromedin N; Contains: RecName: Full=Large neuromedin N; AltName: Full=NmN-125; Contains: RecName: Full=Neuromedin N; Short=NN; Short=NmN; Contains: RecName: Full=Neurotensin; Short=NT; Contains: RecName: Full=Tail peptide; Flags: Precursor [Mus musculus]AAH43024.1 Neurotensin [Mus musculus]AAK15263.1 neurotensin/neuromedin N [Mus musculus]AAK28626.1 neuro|eukprot:NP_077755.1 neurotensin/neuromedin N precursor [Mus musculus]